jgi:hypothetical protein
MNRRMLGLSKKPSPSGWLGDRCRGQTKLSVDSQRRG